MYKVYAYGNPTAVLFFGTLDECLDFIPENEDNKFYIEICLTK